MSEVLDLPPVTTVPLGELLTDIRNGLVVEQEKELPGIPITRIETISKGTVDMGRVRYVRDTAGKSLDNFWLKKGDILFSHINSDLHLGKTALVLSDAPLLHGMNLLRLRVDSIRLRPKYLHHWLDYCRRTGVFMAIAQHAVNQSSLNQKKITSLAVPLPPVGEQDEIVAELEKQFSRLDEAVANLQRVKANLKRYKASVLKAAVEGRLVETEATLARREGRTYETGEHLLQRIVDARGELKKSRAKAVGTFDGSTEAPSGLPSGWQLTSTDEIGHVQLGRQRSPKNRSKDFPVKYIRAANITASGLDLSDVLDMEFSADEVERYRLRAGDIVLSEASGSPEHVGKPAVWQEQMPVCCFQNTVIRLRPALPISAFLLICFQSYYVNGVFARIAGGVGINHLSAEKFSRVKVPLPPLAEQTRIVAEVDRHLSIIREVEAEVDANLQRAQALRQATLAKAFSYPEHG